MSSYRAALAVPIWRAKGHFLLLNISFFEVIAIMEWINRWHTAVCYSNFRYCAKYLVRETRIISKIADDLSDFDDDSDGDDGQGH